jgi:adenylosuccinate synthase
MELAHNKVNMIIDGQFGSTGKGALACYLAQKGYLDQCSIIASTLSPNAGHTFYVDRCKYVSHQIPVSAVVGNDRSTIYLSAGAVIDVEGLLHECRLFDIDPARLVINPNACVVTDRALEEENASTDMINIGSTQSGTGSARVDKLKRKTDAVAKYNKTLCDNFTIHPLNLNQLIGDYSQGVFVETGQGYSLGIDQPFYPYCTSRNCTPAAILNDLGVHPSHLGKVIMSIRAFPIRVGNPVDEDGKEIGWSGPFYEDSEELDWSNFDVDAERTTVTGRIRRIATFSKQQYRDALVDIQPDYIFLNFANYLCINDIDGNEELKKTMAGIRKPTLIGYGPYTESITYWDKTYDV